MPRAKTGIDIQQDLAYERHKRITERVGWTAFALLIAAALFGLFGDGLLSSRTIGGGAFAAEIPRFVRYDSPAEMAVQLDAGSQLWVSISYLQRFEILEITPQPESSWTASGWVVYTFEPVHGADQVRFNLRRREWGRASGRIGPTAAESYSFWQFIYP